MFKKISLTFDNLDKEIYYEGNLELLNNKKISIVGSRRPSNYTKSVISQLAKKLSVAGITIVSGGAMGVDIVAHESAGFDNTIMVSGTGLDIIYPKINKNKILKIKEEGLIISPFKEGTPSLPRNFVIRNELIVKLCEVLIVGEAEIDSGSYRSIEFALKHNKKIYVLPHRLGQSCATNYLLKKNKANAIYDIDEFVENFGEVKKNNDEILLYCESNPTYEEALKKFGQKIFEYELLGKIEIKNGRINIV